MPDSKITALTNLTAADAINDMFPIVDVSDNSITASGTTKRISVNNLLSSSPTASGALTITGLVTAGSATITGALTANGGVNLANATAINFGGLLTFYSDTAAGLFIRGRTVTGTTFQTQDGTQPLLNISNAGVFTWSDGAGGTRMTLDSTGLAVANGNVILSTSGKGIDFSATANSSGTMTSELLNDYEEGTFTPTIDGSTTAGAGTYTSQTGGYTKVGNLVTFQVFIDWTAHTGTGNMNISNLPFTNGAGLWACTAGYVNGIALTAGNILTAYIGANDNKVNLLQYPTGGGSTTPILLDTAGTIVLSGSYTV